RDWSSDVCSSDLLRMQRTGHTVTTSYWDGTAWQPAGSVTVDFPTTQVGLYALAAQDGAAHTAVFDYVALETAEGADQVPDGAFTLVGPGEARYLVAADDGLALGDGRPAATVALAAPAVDGAGGTSPVTLAVGGRPVVVSGSSRLSLGAAGEEAAALRLTDAGGGKVWLRSAADPELYAGVRASDGAL